jgi:hypothetical protein
MNLRVGNFVAQAMADKREKWKKSATGSILPQFQAADVANSSLRRIANEIPPR